MFNLKTKKQTPKCNLNESSYALSAYNRANTNESKEAIFAFHCKVLEQENGLKMHQHKVNTLYESFLKRECPKANNEPTNLSSNLDTRLKSKFFSGCIDKQALLLSIGKYKIRLTSLVMAFDTRGGRFRFSSQKVGSLSQKALILKNI